MFEKGWEKGLNECDVGLGNYKSVEELLSESSNQCPGACLQAEYKAGYVSALETCE